MKLFDLFANPPKLTELSGMRNLVLSLAEGERAAERAVFEMSVFKKWKPVNFSIRERDSGEELLEARLICGQGLTITSTSNRLFKDKMIVNLAHRSSETICKLKQPVTRRTTAKLVKSNDQFYYDVVSKGRIGSCYTLRKRFATNEYKLFHSEKSSHGLAVIKESPNKCLEIKFHAVCSHDLKSLSIGIALVVFLKHCFPKLETILRQSIGDPEAIPKDDGTVPFKRAQSLPIRRKSRKRTKNSDQGEAEKYPDSGKDTEPDRSWKRHSMRNERATNSTRF